MIKKSIKNPNKIPPYIINKFIKSANNNAILPFTVYTSNKCKIGHNIFDSDWDLLIVLDACRINALKSLQHEYKFIKRVDTKLSVGSRSAEWIANTFDERYKREINNTAYITSNPDSVTVLENRMNKSYTGERIKKNATYRVKKFGNCNYVCASEFEEFKGFYKEGVKTNRGKCVGMKKAPRAISNYAIHLDRHNVDRMILHYMPPHPPYFATTTNDKQMDQATELYKNINILKDEQDRTYKAYLDNLRWVLEEVSDVIENTNREQVIITSDHGYSFSKYGHSHTAGSIKPSVRMVPWASVRV